MRTVLVLLSMWGSTSLVALLHWRRAHALSRRDDQLKALLAGKVPLPRTAPDTLPSGQRSAV